MSISQIQQNKQNKWNHIIVYIFNRRNSLGSITERKKWSSNLPSSHPRPICGWKFSIIYWLRQWLSIQRRSTIVIVADVSRFHLINFIAWILSYPNSHRHLQNCSNYITMTNIMIMNLKLLAVRTVDIKSPWNLLHIIQLNLHIQFIAVLPWLSFTGFIRVIMSFVLSFAQNFQEHFD